MPSAGACAGSAASYTERGLVRVQNWARTPLVAPKALSTKLFVRWLLTNILKACVSAGYYRWRGPLHKGNPQFG